MIDIRQLRDDPERYRRGAELKGITLDFDRLLGLESERRAALTEMENLRAEQRRVEKESGPQIGRLAGQIKKAEGEERARLEREWLELKLRPIELKSKIQALDGRIQGLDPEIQALLLQVPLPPDPDVPVGRSSDDNVEIRRWAPAWFDPARPFAENKGFRPKSHIELVRDLGLADFERGVKLSGTRHYLLTGEGARLHHAVLRFALDTMVERHGFTPVYVPVIVHERTMIGTGFFPQGREQAYHIEESKRGSASDLFLTGTGEVGLMGIHADEILDEARLPLRYCTVSTCFRREAGAAGKDTAGLYRIHQFEKVEQVVICRADERESREWHGKMISFVEEVLQALELPYRLLQCCTGDLGPKNADMVDIECWMPGRGEAGADGTPAGAFGETHSASRLYDYQCRRLNIRYRGGGSPVVCHSLNNTVIASPRILIPILELYQNPDGSVTVPAALRPYMGGKERIG